MLSHPVFPNHYNSLIQMTRRQKKDQTCYARFTLKNNSFITKDIIKDVVEDYVRDCVIFQMVWFSKNREKIYQKSYVTFKPL